MISRLPFRTRLTLTWMSALMGALLLFGAFSYVVVSVVIGRSYTDRLISSITAIRAVAEIKNGDIVLEKSDRDQLAQILGTRTNGVVTDTYGAVVAGNVTTLPPYVSGALRDSAGLDSLQIRRFESRSGSTLIALAPIYDGGRRVGLIAVWESLEAYRDFLQVFVLALVGIGIGVALLTLAVADVLTKRAMQPLTDLAALVSEIESHDLSERLAWEGADDELGRLCASFDRLLDRLQSVFQRQKRFVADASHELRGPLAVIRAETELALKRMRSGEEYRSALATVHSEVQRLAQLVDDLLTAARVEQQGASQKLVDLALVAGAAAERMKPLAAARDVTIRVDASPGEAVKADPVQLEQVFIALLDNATRHAHAHGFVDVCVTRDDGHVNVSVQDDGSGFSSQALQYATDRFWRDDSARGTQRSGLGLAIVKGVVERFGGRVQLSNAENGGARVTLRFM